MTDSGNNKTRGAGEAEPCALCEEEGIVVINDSWFCPAHLDDGFRQTFQAVAVLKGMTADQADEASQMLLDRLTGVEQSGGE